MPARVALCGVTSSSAPDALPLVARRYVRPGGEDSASVGNAWRCENVHECVPCATAHAAQRGAEVMRCVDGWRASGGEVWLLTLTMRHAFGDDLEGLVVGIRDAWRSVTSSREWKTWARAHDVEHVRRFEATWSTANGWHPHLHVLVFTRGDVDEIEREGWMFEEWVRGIAGAPTLEAHHVPLRSVGVRWERCARDGAYLVKLGLEITAAHTKKAARRDDGVLRYTPFQLLDSIMDGRANGADVAQLEVVWRTWVRTTRALRVRALTWSRGLRARFAEHVLEDASELDASKSVDVAVIPSLMARRLLRGPHTWAFLEAVARGVPRELRRAVLDAYPPERRQWAARTWDRAQADGERLRTMTWLRLDVDATGERVETALVPF